LETIAIRHQRFQKPLQFGYNFSFAKALNRSVTGSMNDLINNAKAWLEEDDVSPHAIGFELNDVLLSALAESKTDFYRNPNEAFKQLSGARNVIEDADG
jgi:hypothetical protein